MMIAVKRRAQRQPPALVHNLYVYVHVYVVAARHSDSGVAHINLIVPHGAGLILRWITVFGYMDLVFN